MKPTHEYCSKYCDIYEGCTRTECNRKPVIYPKEIKMEEPTIYNRWRNAELKSVYKSVPLTKQEMQTKY